MSRYIPEETIEEIRASSDAVEVISDYVRLKRQGRNFVGLCPFHHEKTPSFMVSPEKQIYRCFGCGEGGNVFSFLMKRENLDFPEAVQFLARRAGISIPAQDEPVRSAEMKEREGAYKVNELAKDFYQYILKNHETAAAARSYLEHRGITPETADKFQLGFAPPAWDSLLQFMEKKGCPAAKLEKVGLVLARTKGSPGYYDRFRSRLMFPVWDVRGRVVGFGGRVLDDTLPKYLNSPETLLFNKSSNLYGINRAAGSIRQLDQVILVEGYLDVISCHQAGIENVVASLGTALTKEQGKLLLRYTGQVVIAYDPDPAGVQAAMRGWQVLDDLGCRVKVVTVPDGQDPDKFIHSRGPEEFRHLVKERALSLYEYKTDRLTEENDIYTLEGKFKIASEVIPIIRNLSSEIEKNEAILKLAQKLQLSPEAIRAEVVKKPKAARNSWGKRDKIADLRDNNSKFGLPGPLRPVEKDARGKAEETLLVMMLEDKSVFLEVRDEIGVHFSSKPEYLNIMKLLAEMAEQESAYLPAALFDRLPDQAAAETLSHLMTGEMPAEDKAKIIRDCLKTIQEDELRKQREDLLRQMAEADRRRDQDLRKQLLLEYAKLI